MQRDQLRGGLIIDGFNELQASGNAILMLLNPLRSFKDIISALVHKAEELTINAKYGINNLVGNNNFYLTTK